ncbi:MAG: glycosyltransferase, partial [Lachnospiraceae bacterium]|nr:glycosyltransferase [Lachnospiraceae bacterium]
MIPISVCIITKNEAENLKKCLEALKPYPFEIVVTDTGSEDDSLEVARQYTDRVYEFEWINDFSAARNFCISHATHDTILSLDTDEFLRPLDWEALQEAIRNHPKSLGAIELYSYFDNANGETKQQLSRLERLFDRRHYHFINPIHEILVPLGDIVPASYDAPVCVDHVGYQGTKEKLREKAERDMALIRTEIEADPENPYHYFQLGQSYMLMRDHKNALSWFRKAMELHPMPGADYTLVLLCNYAGILLDDNLAEEAANIFPYHDSFADNKDFLCLCGRIYLHMGQPLKALPEFVQALSAPKYSLDDPHSPSYYIGFIYEMYGTRDIARTHDDHCGPDSPPALEAR